MPRRPRYPGTHPRRFEQKYKELDPARFPDESAKVRARGATPAGTHVPVLLQEVLAALAPRPGQVALDCTLGHGGHAEALLRAVAPDGGVVGIDRDQDEIERTTARLAALGFAPPSFVARAAKFAGASKVLRVIGLETVDLVLADLGTSSMQIDRPERGFSFKNDGPLDMRMDRTRGATAAEWLADQDAATIADALREHGDEPDADEIAAAIEARAPTTTRELVLHVLRAKGLEGWERDDPHELHPAARTFQALRVVVNAEDEQLDQLLRDLPWLLAPGGRAAIIAFHSGESRRVAASFAAGKEAGWFAEAATEPVKPTPDEIHANPRARSARLFTAVRSD